MIKRAKLGLTILALGILLAACGGGQEAAPAQPPVEAPTAAPTMAPVAEPEVVEKEAPVAAETGTDLPAPTVEPTPAAPAPVDWLTTVTVEGDYYILGNPAAPVRLLDYSDFL